MDLENLEPRKVLHYFKEIAAIPHGSGNIRKISDHIATFAKAHGLSYVQDEMGNVVICKPGQGCSEAAPVVMLQGHMDMVCEKEEDCDLDMETEGLRLVLTERKHLDYLMDRPGGLLKWQKEEDPILIAEGTTLGADDGIAVAMMMAVLESDTIVHPPLECVFTVDEEIGLLGAEGLDKTGLKSRMMINLDSEDEGHMLTGCAGGCTTRITLPVTSEAGSDPEQKSYVISVSGLLGGHSGQEIDRGRANAIMLLGRYLDRLFDNDYQRCGLVLVKGGSKDNAIPRNAAAELLLSASEAERAGQLAAELEGIVRGEYGAQDPDIRVTFSEGTISEGAISEKTPSENGQLPMAPAATERVISLLRLLPDGLQKMSFDVPGLVETSLNIGILTTDAAAVTVKLMARSNVNSEKEDLVRRIWSIARVLGAEVEDEADYPAWEYCKVSKLREVFSECFQEQYHEPMIMEAIHAGVECGLFTTGMPGLDAVSIGPQLTDIHTPREAMDIPSVERTWKLVLKVLEELAEQV